MKMLGTILLWVIIVWLAVAVIAALFRKIGAWLSGGASFSDDLVRGGKSMTQRAVRRAQQRRTRG